MTIPQQNSQASSETAALPPGRQLPIRASTWTLILLSSFMGTGVLVSAFMLSRLALRQLRHPVLFDDSWYLTLRDTADPLAWIFRQHNEHRIVMTKLTTLIETDILGLPITSTLTLQSLLLVSLCSGITVILCCKVLLGRWNQLLTWLACTLVLTNPWQWMTFAWEFQTPWLLINALVLATTLLLLTLRKDLQRDFLQLKLVFIATVPWVAIFNNGSGFALAAALCGATLLLCRLAFFVAIGSSVIASFTYFFFLDYTRPWAQYHRYGFDPDFFLRLLFGGPWQGLAILVFAFSLLLLQGCSILTLKAAPKTTEGAVEKSVRTSKIINRDTTLVLSLPAMFAVIFDLMTTLSRSTVGIHYADYSYYVTHSLMLAISLILLVSYVNELIAFQLHGNNVPGADLRLLYPGILVVLSTMLSLPQVITRSAPGFWQAWANAYHHRAQAQETVLCFAARNSLAMKSTKQSPQPCEGADSDRSELIDAYFQGKNPVRPIGWHKILIDGTTDSSNLIK